MVSVEFNFPENSFSNEEKFALNLFNIKFQQIPSKQLNIRDPNYPELRIVLEIIDKSFSEIFVYDYQSKNILYRNKSNRENIIKELIEKFSYFRSLIRANNDYQIIDRRITISSMTDEIIRNNFNLDKYKIFQITRNFEDSKWCGAGKDNAFFDCNEYLYCLKINNITVEDSYVRSLLPQRKVFCGQPYFEYRGVSFSAWPDTYSINEANNEIQNEFLDKYSITEHKNSLML